MFLRRIYTIMKNTLNGFRQFVEEMDPSPEKNREMAMKKKDSNSDKQDYFDSLEDEQGISWPEIVSTLTKEPWVATHFGLGNPKNEILYKSSPWKIVSLTPNGAEIQLMPQRDTKSYLKNNVANKSGYQDKKKYFLQRDQLVDFLTKGWSPAVQQAAGGMPVAPMI